METILMLLGGGILLSVLSLLITLVIARFFILHLVKHGTRVCLKEIKLNKE